MGILSATVHRIMDFVLVAAFAAAPWVFHLNGRTRMLAFGLAAVHLALTLVTHFPGRAKGLVPFRTHGIIEVVVGVVLLVLPFVRNWTYGARTFFPAIGAVILVVWALSRFRHDAVVAEPVGRTMT